jgi:hypothetical protein
VRVSLAIVVEARNERPEAVKLVVEALRVVSLVIVLDAEVRSEIVVVASVVRPLDVNDEVAVIEPPVIVPLVREVKKPVIPVMRLAKKVEEVALVVDALVAKKLVAVALVVLKLAIVPDAEVRSLIVPLVMVVVARVAEDVAVKVPATKLEVVALVAVRLVKKPVIAVKRLEKKVEEVALVVDALVAKKLVAVADVAVRDEMVVVARVEVPVTPSVVPTTTAPEVVRAVDEARPSTV